MTRLKIGLRKFGIFWTAIVLGFTSTERGAIGQCVTNPVNQAVYEGTLDTVMSCNSTCPVTWIVTPSSDPLGRVPVVSNNTLLMSSIYAFNQTGLIILKATTLKAGEQITSAGAYIVQCANNQSNRVSAKLVVVRSGPVCSSYASNSSPASSGDSVTLSCSVAYADVPSNAIKPITTMRLDGIIVSAETTNSSFMAAESVYVTTSTIVRNCSDYQFFQCQLRFAPPELTVDYIAKNAPDFNRSCSLPLSYCKRTTTHSATTTALPPNKTTKQTTATTQPTTNTTIAPKTTSTLISRSQSPRTTIKLPATSITNTLRTDTTLTPRTTAQTEITSTQKSPKATIGTTTVIKTPTTIIKSSYATNQTPTKSTQIPTTATQTTTTFTLTTTTNAPTTVTQTPTVATHAQSTATEGARIATQTSTTTTRPSSSAIQVVTKATQTYNAATRTLTTATLKLHASTQAPVVTAQSPNSGTLTPTSSATTRAPTTAIKPTNASTQTSSATTQILNTTLKETNAATQTSSVTTQLPTTTIKPINAVAQTSSETTQKTATATLTPIAATQKPATATQTLPVAPQTSNTTSMPPYAIITQSSKALSRISDYATATSNATSQTLSTSTVQRLETSATVTPLLSTSADPNNTATEHTATPSQNSSDVRLLAATVALGVVVGIFVAAATAVGCCWGFSVCCPSLLAAWGTTRYIVGETPRLPRREWVPVPRETLRRELTVTPFYRQSFSRHPSVYQYRLPPSNG